MNVVAGASRRAAWARVVVAALLLGAAATGRATQAAAQSGPAAQAAGEGFQVGDRILLRVDGEQQLTDTFTVTAGPAVVLPVVGSVPLQGISRGRVERTLTDAIAKFIREPVVHVRVLMRIAVFGEVQRPGYYLVPYDMVIPDVLMIAGGPTATARVDGLRVLRENTEIIPVDALKKALAQGETLAQIGVRSEDQVVIPKAADTERTVRMITAWLAIPVALVTVLLVLKH